jgi:hypothetical protein
MNHTSGIDFKAFQRRWKKGLSIPLDSYRIHYEEVHTQCISHSFQDSQTSLR